MSISTQNTAADYWIFPLIAFIIVIMFFVITIMSMGNTIIETLNKEPYGYYLVMYNNTSQEYMTYCTKQNYSLFDDVFENYIIVGFYPLKTEYDFDKCGGYYISSSGD